jgi:carbamoyltransferase
MYTLGINACFHDSSACLIKDGILLAAAEEERFTQIKHGKRPVPFSTYELPFHAIDYCLSVAGLHINDIDFFGYSFDPHILTSKDEHESMRIPADQSTLDSPWSTPWEPLFLTYILRSREFLQDGWPHHLQARFSGAKIDKNRWRFVAHHLSHAVSAFFPSPFEQAAVLSIDGRGELATTSYYVGANQSLAQFSQVELPHSLGLLYEEVTSHLGFLRSSDEYRVMALASYGKPEFEKVFRSMIRRGHHGHYEINDAGLESALGPARKRGEPFTKHHFNVAHSLQKVLQETVLDLTEWLHRETGEEKLCMAGGVALNCVMNAFLRDNGPFKEIWVQPAAGDAGTALGAALWVDAMERDTDEKTFVMEHAYWGPGYSDEAIERFLKWTKTPYHVMDDVADETAQLLAEGKIIGWFQGRMEFGPRALGSRSILASPIDPGMQAKLNEVKDREDFRPVAPAVMEEYASDWFEGATKSPFMLFTFNVRPDKADQIPAVRHVDGTARIQTVNEQQHPAYYRLLDAFRKRTGVPVLINTSFNTLGKPIVCSPRDALECFWASPFDALVIGSFLVRKETNHTDQATSHFVTANEAD